MYHHQIKKKKKDEKKKIQILFEISYQLPIQSSKIYKKIIEIADHIEPSQKYIDINFDIKEFIITEDYMLLKQFFTTDEYLKIMINNVQHISNEQDEIEIYIPLKSFQIAGIKKIKGIFNGLQVQIMLSKAFQAKKDIDTLYALDIISTIPAPIIKKEKSRRYIK